MKPRSMRQCLVRQRSLQWFITSARSALEPARKRLYRVCFAIVLVGMVLSSQLLLLPSTEAQAAPTGLAGVSEQMELASQPSHQTTQLPAGVANRLREALSKQTKIPAVKLKLVEASPKTWTNGCLDLARSDEICTQALVKGWRVVFSNRNQHWIYRTDQQGRSYRLEP